MDLLLLYQVLPVGVMGLALTSYQTLRTLQLLVSPILNLNSEGA